MIRRPQGEKPVINLDGPDGNAFALMGIALNLARQLGLDGKAITKEMKFVANDMGAGYEGIITVFENYFGDYVILESSTLPLLDEDA